MRVSGMRLDLYRNPAEPFPRGSVFLATMIMAGRTDVTAIGRYRTHD